MTPFHSTSKSDFCVWKIPCVLKIFSKPRLVKNSRATGVKMRPEMVKEIQIEILNGKEILVNCKFKSKNNLNLNLYRKILRNSNPIKISIRLCTMKYREI